MAKTVRKTAMDNAVDQLKALLPALEQYLNAFADNPSAEAKQGESKEGAEAGSDPIVTESAESAAVAEPEGDDGVAGDIAGLIASVEAVLSELKGIAKPAADNGAEGMEGAASDPMVEDVIEGLNTGEKQPSITDAELVEGQGKASAGPSAGKHTGADAAVSRFYADLATKNKTYERLSKVVGAFDHAAMDAKAVNAYGVKKLGIKCAAGQEHIALDAYLTGIEFAQKTTKQRIKTVAADSSAANVELDAYLKGTK